MKTSLYHLENFGLTIKDIGKKDFSISTKAYLTFPNVNKYINKHPNERKKLLDRCQHSKFQSLISSLESKTYTLIGTKVRPSGVHGWFNSNDFLKIYNSRKCSSIFIEKIKGLRYKDIKDENQNYFCVKAEYVIQIENQKKGLQSHEFRYLLVKAKSPKEAERQVKKDSKKYGEPYLNDDMELVRWKLFKILDVEYINDDINGGIVEIFSEMFDKRINPKLIWENKYKK